MSPEKSTVVATLAVVTQQTADLLARVRTSQPDAVEWVESVKNMSLDLRDTLASSGDAKLDPLTFTTIDSIANAFGQLKVRFPSGDVSAVASDHAARLYSLLTTLGISRAADGRLILPSGN
jgi:hypothetical protein